MKRPFNLSAVSSATLVLIASALALPMQANAADRQIVPTAKIKSFTVQDTNEVGATEVAANPEQQPPRRKKPKVLQIEDNNQASNGGNIKPKSFTVTDETEQAEATPVKPKRPAPPKIQEFRVDEDTGEVADTPITEAENDVAVAEPASQPKRPAKKLKPAPAPVEESEEAAAAPDVTEEEQAAAIASDQPEAAAEEPEVAAAQEDDDEPTILRKVSKLNKVKRYKHYPSYDGVQDDYAYQPSAYGSNCHQNYSY